MGWASGRAAGRPESTRPAAWAAAGSARRVIAAKRRIGGLGGAQ